MYNSRRYALKGGIEMNQRKNKYFHFILGTAILAFGMCNIHSHCRISEGGVLGATLLIQYWFHISPSISSFIIDTTLFMTGAYVFGKKFLKDALICTISYSSWYAIFETIGLVLPDLSDFPLLAAILGAMFVGLGIGFIIIHDGACGGDDVIALIMQKKFKIPMFYTYFISDAIVLLLSLTYIPFTRIMYSLISVLISGRIIDFFHRYSQKINGN